MDEKCKKMTKVKQNTEKLQKNDTSNYYKKNTQDHVGC